MMRSAASQKCNRQEINLHFSGYIFPVFRILKHDKTLECRNKITVIPKWLSAPNIQRAWEFLVLGNLKKKIEVGAFIVMINRDAFEPTHVSRHFFSSILKLKMPLKKNKTVIPTRSRESRCENQKLLRNMLYYQETSQLFSMPLENPDIFL